MGKRIETTDGASGTTSQEEAAVIETYAPNAEYTVVPATETEPEYIEFSDTAPPSDIEVKQIEMALLGPEGQAETFTALVDALATLRTYIAIASPTTAQNTAQIKAQANVLVNLVRYVTREFDL